MEGRYIALLEGVGAIGSKIKKTYLWQERGEKHETSSRNGKSQYQCKAVCYIHP